MQVRMQVRQSIGDPFSGYLEDDNKYINSNIIFVQTEQQTAKLEILNYISIADDHLFLVGDDSNGWQEHKVLVEGNYYIDITGNTVNIYEIKQTIDEQLLNSYGSIDIVKNKLFKVPSKGKQIKAIPNYKAARAKYDSIANAIKGKYKKVDIWNTIMGILNGSQS